LPTAVVGRPDTSGRSLWPAGVRCAAAIVFLIFGVSKFVNHAAELASFRHYPVPAPGTVVYAVGVIEIGGGLLLLVGLLTRLTALALAADMLGAIVVSGLARWEIVSLTLAPVLLAAMIILIRFGAGDWSLDRHLAANSGDPQARQAVAPRADSVSTVSARSTGQLMISGDRATADPPLNGPPPGGWSAAQPRVVVIGGGFAGLRVVRELRRAAIEVTLLDRRNFHLFQPLLYQVASGALSPGEIAYPLRGLLARQPNARVLMADVAAIDLPGRRVRLRPQSGGVGAVELPYDWLVVATGAGHSYFGHDGWARHAPGLKTLEDALEIRRRILTAFEAAELETCPERRGAWLTFAVVGAGPTGVEIAGQIAELARDTLRREFRTIDPGEAVILLIEAAGRVLTAYEPKMSARAANALRRLGVTPVLNAAVVEVGDQSISIAVESGDVREVQARTIIWAAGVSASPLARALAEASGAELDRAGRITVQPDLTLPGFPEVFAVGDMVRVSDGAGSTVPIPGVAPAAIQEGRHAARTILRRLARRPAKPFTYRDKGSLATIGRKAAVAQIHGAMLSGLLAWLAWLLVHLYFLMGLQNRFIVFVRWTVSFITRGRSARLITETATRGDTALLAGTEGAMQ
jgi:NADH dehydrogenase